MSKIIMFTAVTVYDFQPPPKHCSTYACGTILMAIFEVNLVCSSLLKILKQGFYEPNALPSK